MVFLLYDSYAIDYNYTVMKKSKFIFILFLITLLILLICLGMWNYLGMGGEIDKITGGANSSVERIEITPEPTPEPAIEVTPETTEEPHKPVSVVFTGDFLIGDLVKSNYDAKGMEGVISPELLGVLNDADITMVNNEFPYSTRGEQAKDKQYTFRLDPSYVEVAKQLGVDVAGLANNHVLDYGREALTDTMTTLEGAEIEFCGSGYDMDEAAKLVVKEIDGVKYGFVASSHVIPFGHWDIANGSPGVFTFYDSTKLVKRIEEYKQQCDYLYVFVHWGIEHTDELKEYQIREGHAMIDAGADAVIGMHSHCLQPMEMYQGKPIFYSLGNFIFGTNINSAAVVRLTYEEPYAEPVVEVIPTFAVSGYTDAAAGENKQEIISYLNSISETVIIDEEGKMSAK